MTRTKITFADTHNVDIISALSDAIQSWGGADAEREYLDDIISDPDRAFDFYDVDGLDIEVERNQEITGDEGYSEVDLKKIYS